MDNEFLNYLRFEPLDETNWPSFVQLFGKNGACGNCWCMYYRLKKADFSKGKADYGNRNSMHELVLQGRPTGILTFYNEEPIAWCAFAPREDFIKLENSRIHKRIDMQPVWSIPCLFVAKNYRNLGVNAALLKGVIDYAREKGIKIIEAYPLIPSKGRLPDAFAWVGLYRTFDKMGFEIVNRKSPNRPMVRYYIGKK